MLFRKTFVRTFILPFVLLSCHSGQAAERFTVTPAEVLLEGPYAQVQLLVQQTHSEDTSLSPERQPDISALVQFTSSDPSIVAVAPQGRLLAHGDGQSVITVAWNGESVNVPIVVKHNSAPIGFTRDLRPLLNKTGCAAAACHASQHGKGGFKLSVFGFDPKADFESIARQSGQRRINLASPDLSLVLRKPAMQMAHGGGKRLDVDSVEYNTFRDWIGQGVAGPGKEDTHVTKIVVSPQARVGKLGFTQQLRVVAHYSDETLRDVTSLARYDAIDDGIVEVDGSGHVVSVGKGQTSVMIRFEERVGTSTFLTPFASSIELATWKNNNYIDEIAATKFHELGLQPSEVCDDATFVRRAFFDAIGSLPSPDETKQFIDSADPQKREKLVDQLLGLTGDPKLDIYNDRYAAFWTLKWSDLIRNNSNTVGEQGMWALHNWIKESFRTNKPFDKFVRELVTAKGSIYSNGPANYFRINANSSALTESTAQIFLGVRLECAKCHHHPFESYSQADYYQLAAFFSRVTSKNSEEFGIFGRETIVMVRGTGDVRHPRTGKLMEPTPLGGEPIDDPLDRRLPLADWLTSPTNTLFAKSIANRYMGYLMGRGLVEPIDDMRSTNPPSNAALLDALSRDFASNGYDLKRLMRTIMTSRLYQLSSAPTASNASDRRFYSHYRVKRLPAEPLLDAIDQATGVKTKFRNLPLGTNATELPDAEYPNYFLTTFAKPRRASVCECERMPDENLAQALHTLNGDTLATKIASSKGRVALLLASKVSHEQIVREIYMAALCRWPNEAELAMSNEFLAESPTPKECYEDLLWALLNSKQFLFVH